MPSGASHLYNINIVTKPAWSAPGGSSGSPRRDSVHHCLALPPVSLPVTSAEQVVRTRKVIYAGGVRVTVSGQ